MKQHPRIKEATGSGAIVRDMRNKLKLTQSNFGTLYGCTALTVSKAETSSRMLPLKTMIRLRKEMNFDINTYIDTYIDEHGGINYTTKEEGVLYIRKMRGELNE